MSKERLEEITSSVGISLSGDGQAYEKLKDENETLSSALNDARHEISILKNNIRRKNQVLKYYADDTIYDAQYKLDIMRDLGDRAKRELARG